MDEKEGTEQDIAVKNVVLHPKWNIETKKTSNGMKILTTHDIALIQLSHPVKFSANVNSMCLDDGQPFKAGKTCITSFSSKSDPHPKKKKKSLVNSFQLNGHKVGFDQPTVKLERSCQHDKLYHMKVWSHCGFTDRPPWTCNF